MPPSPSAGKRIALPPPPSYLAWTPAEQKRLLLSFSCGATLLTLVLTLAHEHARQLSTTATSLSHNIKLRGTGFGLYERI